MDYAFSFTGEDATNDANAIGWQFDNVQPRKCPGFCGRVANMTFLNVNSSSSNEIGLSSCQACPWGFVADADSLCVKCTVPLRAYDYCFLIFHALVPLLVHALFLKIYANIRVPAKRTGMWLAVQVLCAVVESSLAVALAMLMVEPRGSLTVVGCPTRSGIRAWYPALFEPVVDYTRYLDCVNEIVYPLFFLPFIILAFFLANAAIFRTFLYVMARYVFNVRLHSAPFYATLWTLPLCAIAHAILSGILYYMFPYLCVVASLALNVTHLALEGRRSIRQMFVLILSLEHATLVVAHMALLGFGVTAIIAAGDPPFWSKLTLIGIVLPAPTCFYVLTIQLTAPPTRVPRHRR